MSSAKRILVIDDDSDFVETTKIVLEGSGYEVITASNSNNGMKKAKAKKKRPDVILLDVMMENLCSGFEAARELREAGETKDIPIIMVTAVNANVPFRFDPHETWLPVDRFLEKPVSSKVLIEEVQRVLSSGIAKGESR